MARLTTLLFAMWLGVTVSTEVDLEKRIIGGQKCGPKERLYHVKLITTDTNGDQYLCGGSLISDQWILTAAHCFKPGGKVIAVIGVHPGPPKEVEITASPEIFKDYADQQHDLMLLKLPKAVEDIKPVQGPDCKDRPNIGAVVQVAGHASTQAKRRKKLPGFTDTLQCADMNIIEYQLIQPDQTIFYSKPKVDTCVGDSGGGVVYKDKIYGVHITSDDKIVCAESAEAMDLCHTRYLKWINKIINPSRANAAIG